MIDLSTAYLSIDKLNESKEYIMKLYELAMLPNPRRVRIFLAEKGLLNDIELVQVDVLNGEHRTAEFKAKNPTATAAAHSPP